MKVEQYLHANQFHLYGNGKVIEIEYLNGKRVVTLGRDWDYSTTTSKHVYAFLEEYAHIITHDKANKRAYIQKLIDNNDIFYNEDMH